MSPYAVTSGENGRHGEGQSRLAECAGTVVVRREVTNAQAALKELASAESRVLPGGPLRARPSAGQPIGRRLARRTAVQGRDEKPRWCAE
jgi:hypothetical protein